MTYFAIFCALVALPPIVPGGSHPPRANLDTGA
jgi:hypothetical protein